MIRFNRVENMLLQYIIWQLESAVCFGRNLSFAGCERVTLTQKFSMLVFIREGDETRFFASSLMVQMWKVFYLLKNEIKMHFQNHFSSKKWDRRDLVTMNISKIYVAVNESLVARFSEEEIKEAVWGCESAKSLGPDGIIFSFVKIFGRSSNLILSCF